MKIEFMQMRGFHHYLLSFSFQKEVSNSEQHGSALVWDEEKKNNKKRKENPWSDWGIIKGSNAASSVENWWEIKMPETLWSLGLYKTAFDKFLDRRRIADSLGTNGSRRQMNDGILFAG